MNGDTYHFKALKRHIRISSVDGITDLIYKEKGGPIDVFCDGVVEHVPEEGNASFAYLTGGHWHDVSINFDFDRYTARGVRRSTVWPALRAFKADYEELVRQFHGWSHPRPAID